MRVSPISQGPTFSWKNLFKPTYLLTFLLYAQGAFARQFSPQQCPMLTDRCSKDMCCLSLDRIREIREAVLPTPRPWEFEQCVPWESREQEIKNAMEGLREEMALQSTSFGPKHDHLDQMADLMDLLQAPRPIITRPGGFRLDPSFLAAIIAPLWKKLCKVRPLNLKTSRAQELLKKIQEKIAEVSLSFPSGLQKWLQSMNGLVIVRSSASTEDREGQANAGGNLSKISRPILSELKSSARDVFSSYSSEFSLENQLNSGADPCEREFPSSLFFQPYIRGDVSFVHFSGKPSVTSSTYGDGIGVVGAEGTRVDTDHCLPSRRIPSQLYCHRHIENKRKKWVPDSNGALDTVANSKSDAIKASLTPAQVKETSFWATVFRYFFGYEAVDIEGLKKGDPNFVQLRPYSEEDLSSSTYLDLEEVPNAVFADTLVHAHNSVIVLSRKEELLVASSWQEAWNRYDPAIHKAVVVSQSASPTSHFVLSFKKRIPCFLVDDLKAIREMSFPLGICPQTGRIFPWKESFASSVQKGVAVHSAKIVPSLLAPYPFLKILPQAPRDLRLLLKKNSIRPDQLEEFFSHDVYKPFWQKKEALFQELEGLSFVSEAIAERKKALEEYETIISEVLEEIRAFLKQPGDRMEMLFFLKVLEQTARIDVEHLLSSLRDLISYQSQLSHSSQLAHLLLFGRAAPSEEAFNRWKQSLLEVEGRLSQKEIEQIESFLMALGDSLPTWLLFFQPKDGLKDLPVLSDQAFFESILQTQQGLDSIPSDLFANPKTFSAAWERLQVYLQFLLFPPFLRQIQVASPMTRLSAYALLRKSIEKLDQATKDMLDSDHPEELVYFEEMVRFFFQILDSWMKNLIPKGVLPKTKGGWSLEHYLARGIAFPPMEPSQLFPSANFNVAASLLGASKPKSWHDLWTLAHQVFLLSLGRLNEIALPEELIKTSFLPDEIKKAIVTIEQTDWGREINRLCIEVDEEEVRVRYNNPLGDHSGQAGIVCRKSGECLLWAKLFGLGEGRAFNFSTWLQALQKAGIFQWEELFSSPEELMFSCSGIQNLSTFLKEYMAMAEFSMGGRFSEALLNLFERWKEHQLPLVNYFLEMAEVDIGSDESLIKRALEIWKALFKIGKGYQSAIKAAEAAGKSGDQKLIRQITFPLATELVKKGLIYEKAEELAKNFAEYKDLGTQQIIFKLWVALVEEGQSYKEAIRTAERGMKNDDWNIRLMASKLWDALLKKGQGIQVALRIARAHPTLEKPIFRQVSLNLLRSLIQQGKGLKMAIQAAQAGAGDENPQVRTAALELWRALFEEGWGYEEGVQMAETLVKDHPHPAMKVIGLHLFKELVLQGYGYEAAEEGAKANIHISYLQKLSSDVLEILKEKNR